MVVSEIQHLRTKLSDSTEKLILAKLISTLSEFSDVLDKDSALEKHIGEIITSLKNWHPGKRRPMICRAVKTAKSARSNSNSDLSNDIKVESPNSVELIDNPREPAEERHSLSN